MRFFMRAGLTTAAFVCATGLCTSVANADVQHTVAHRPSSLSQ